MAWTVRGADPRNKKADETRAPRAGTPLRMNAYVLMRVLSAVSLTTILTGCDGDDGARPDGVWDPGEDDHEPIVDDGGGGGGDSGAGDSGRDDGGTPGEKAYDCPAPATECSGW